MLKTTETSKTKPCTWNLFLAHNRKKTRNTKQEKQQQKHQQQLCLDNFIYIFHNNFHKDPLVWGPW